MAHQVWIRPFNDKDEGERRLLVEWLYAARERNRFDPVIFERGQVALFTFFDDTGVIGFVPISLAYVVESLAFKPGLSRITEAKALQSMQQMLVCRATEKNIPDAYFAVSDEAVKAFAQNYGWQEVQGSIMNLNFAHLEGDHESHGKS